MLYHKIIVIEANLSQTEMKQKRIPFTRREKGTLNILEMTLQKPGSPLTLTYSGFEIHLVSQRTDAKEI